jgi:uncharacterized membrane protein (DUF2068 family)
MTTGSEFRAALNLRGHRGQVKVLRAVASFELAKGLVVLAAGCGVLMLLHKDTSEIAQNLLQLLHISPDHRVARVFLEWIALISGAAYLPYEVRELIRKLSFFHVTLLVVNLAVVLYMVYLRWEDQEGDGSGAAPQ